MNLIIPNTTPRNRSMKRKMWREYERISKVLHGAEDRFVNQLFQEDIDYNDLYIHYLAQFNENIEFTMHKIKPKYHTINNMYFQDSFKPIEML